MVETVLLKLLLLSYLSSFGYVFKLNDFCRISKKCISWRMLPKFQQGRRWRVGQSFALELQDFTSLLNGNPKLVESAKDLKIGECFISLLISTAKVGGANLCFPPCWIVVSLFLRSVSAFDPHGYEVIDSVAQPSSVKVPKTLTGFKHRIGRLW